MPIVKTEITARTRANVAYAAALLDLSESQIYGLILDGFGGVKSPEELVKVLEKLQEKGTGKDGGNGSSSQ